MWPSACYERLFAMQSTPFECIPMARELIRLGTAEQVLERLEAEAAQAEGSPRRCIFYEPHGPEEDGK